MAQNKILAGLKLLRKNTVDKTPKYNCDGCGCKRYSKCGCKKEEVKTEEVKEVQ